MKNYWLSVDTREKDEKWLKVVRWAQKNKILVEHLTESQISEVLKSDRISSETLKRKSEEIL